MTRRQGIGFAVFCLIGGSRWIIDGVLPARLPLFESASLHYLLIGLIAFFILIIRRRTSPALAIPWFRLAIASMLLLSLPTLLNESAHDVTAATKVGLFALTPLLLVVGASSSGEGLTKGRVLMMPALIGLSGMLLLVPFQLPSSLTGGLSFGISFAAVLLTAVGSLWIYSLLRQCGWISAVMTVCGANALVMGLAAAATHELARPLVADLPIELLRCAALDLPLLLLLVWLLQAVPPSRLASRFLIVPLVSVIEGAFLLHAPIDLRMVFGTILIVFGAVALLFSRAFDDLEHKSLLGLR